MAPELERQLAAYHPCCEQEAVDRDVMLHFLRENTDAFTRENLVAHFTASSWIVNSSRTHALMAWHNLYRAWSWTAATPTAKQTCFPWLCGRPGRRRASFTSRPYFRRSSHWRPSGWRGTKSAANMCRVICI